MRELFDCHVHLGETDSGELYYGHLRGEEYLRLMEDAGVKKALVFPPYMKQGYREANLRLAKWCGAQSGGVRALARIGGKGVVLPKLAPWLVRKNLRRLVLPKPADLQVEELNQFAGVKLLPLVDGLPGGKMFRAINERRMPYLIHGGVFTDAKWISRWVLPKVETKIVIAHLGAFPGISDLIDDAIELAGTDKRVYLDTSGIWKRELLERAVARVPKKLLFGSDSPLTHPRVAWQAVRGVVKDDGLARRIGWEAAEEVFG